MTTRTDTVVVDIDGVIADPAEYDRADLTGPQKYEGAALLHGAKEALAELVAAGYTVILHTARSEADRDVTKTWLAKHGIEHVTHYEYLICGKPSAILYVDDRGHRFDGWPGVFAALEEAPEESCQSALSP